MLGLWAGRWIYLQAKRILGLEEALQSDWLQAYMLHASVDGAMCRHFDFAGSRFYCADFPQQPPDLLAGWPYYRTAHFLESTQVGGPGCSIKQGFPNLP